MSTHRATLSALLSWELDGHASVLVGGAEPPPPKYPPATLLAVPLFHVTGRTRSISNPIAPSESLSACTNGILVKAPR